MISYTLLMAAGANLGEWQTKTSVLPVTEWVSSTDWTNANYALVKSTSYAYKTFVNLESSFPEFTVDTSSLPAGKKVEGGRIKLYVGAQYTNRIVISHARIFMEAGGVPFSSYNIPVLGYQSNLNTPLVADLDDPDWNWGWPPYNVVPMGTTDLVKQHSKIELDIRNISSASSGVRLYFAELEIDYKEWVPFTGKKDYSYWRILVTAGNSDDNIYIYEIQFRETKGVDQPSVHGTDGVAIESTHYSTYVIANAFNGTPTSSYWAVQKSTLPQWGGFKYTDGGGANDPLKPRDVEQVLIRGSPSSAATSAPTKVDIEASEDGVTWEKIKADVALTGWAKISGGDFRLIDLV